MKLGSLIKRKWNLIGSRFSFTNGWRELRAANFLGLSPKFHLIFTEAAPNSWLRHLQLGHEEENNRRNPPRRDNQDHRREVENGVSADSAGLRSQGCRY